MTETMTPAEFAAYRHLIGLSARKLAEVFEVRVTTVQDWESGRRGERPPARVAEGMLALVSEHTGLAESMASAGVAEVPREPSSRPRGWYVAAAAHALALAPIEVRWAEKNGPNCWRG